MKAKTWLATLTFMTVAADWYFKVVAENEFLSAKWFLASCIFAAAYFVVSHQDERGG